MEAPEVPLEQVQEHLEHHAHEGGDKFVSGIALTTAILAAFAAVASLLAGDHADEAMISQIRSSDQWAFFQAKGIKSAILGAKGALLESQGKPAVEKDVEKMKQYGEEQAEIKKEAEGLQHEAEEHIRKHKWLASSVTLLQIAIAIGAISALTKKRIFWYVSLIFGLIGIGLLIRAGLLA